MEKSKASQVTQRPLIFQDENINVPHKKAVRHGKPKNSKATKTKGGAAFGGRKALNDITNKSFCNHGASSKKKNQPKVEFNVAEEQFLHDHRKCIEAQKALTLDRFLDTVLPGHDSISSVEFAETTKSNPRFYPDPEELPMWEFSDWFGSSTRWASPPSSPLHWDSSPCSTLAWEFEPIEIVLKSESDC